MKRIAGISIAAATFALVLSVFVAGCSDPIMPGGPCFYTHYPGTATIRTVTPDTSSTRNCDTAVIIVFDFAPDDSSAVDRYRIPSWPDTGRTFQQISGGSVPVGWAEKEGMTPGSGHRCERSEIRRGACTPVVFDFLDVDISDWPDYCD